MAELAVQDDERTSELRRYCQHILDVCRGFVPPQQGRCVRVQQRGAVQDIPHNRMG